MLNGSTPLILAAGNHDTGPSGKRSSIETPLLDTLYPPVHFHSNPWFGGVFESHSIKNAYYLIDTGGVSFIVVSLEFGPRDEVLQWADTILARHQHRHAIVVTHCYLNYDGTRVDEDDAYNPHRYPNGGNDGEEIWNKLIRRHANVSFVLSGHVGGDGTDRKISRGDNGNVVHELLSNYQHRRSGGNGWLRIMEFVPDHDKVFVSTYSPYLNRYDTRNKNRFELEFLME
jgi:hypothetical protein